MRVRLYAAKGAGVVLSARTGVSFSNQAGGTSCLQPELEGVYVPIDDDFATVETRLLDYFTGPKHRGTGATRGLDSDDADCIDEILHTPHAPLPFEVDRNRLSDSIEAWVFVRLRRQDEPIPILEGFPSGAEAVLTWGNSD